MIICTHCNKEIAENYCSNCGQAAKSARIDRHYIQHEIVHYLHFEKGIFYTLKELIVRPGKSVNSFLAGNRSRLVKPIIFLLLSSLIYTLINHYFHIEDGYVKLNAQGSLSATKANQWIQNNYGYTNLLMGGLIAAWLKLFFKKYDYNFFEILILLCFVMGTGMLIFAIGLIVEGLTKFSAMQFASAIGFAYITWAIGNFFDRKKLPSYFKAIAAYLLGMLTFSLLVVLIVFLYSLILKK